MTSEHLSKVRCVSASVGQTRVPSRFQMGSLLFIVSNGTQFMTVRVQEMRNLLQWEISCDVETVRIHMFILGKKAFALALLLSIFKVFQLGCQSYSFYLNVFHLFGVKHIPSVISFTSLKTKRRLLYLKTQSVPRCKHFSSRL